MNMQLLSVVTPPYIYHSWYTRKMFWEGNFTPVIMKHCGHCNVEKHRDINNGEKYITVDISLNFGSLDKMKIISSEPKHYLWGNNPVWRHDGWQGREVRIISV